MKRLLLILAVIATAAGCPAKPSSTAKGTAKSSPPNAKVEKLDAAGSEVLAKLLAMNGPDAAAPPTDFRSGHVGSMALAKDAITRTKNGFVVKLPSGAPITTPAVHDGKVYVSGGFHSREFFAFEGRTGKLVWGASLDDDGPSSPACEGRICVVNTESCTIFGLDAQTGEQKWSWWLGDPLTSAPTIADGRVFTSYPASQGAGGKPRPAGATHVLAAFDLETGKILWQRWIDADIMSAPVASGEFVYAATFAGTVMKLEQATGKFRYAFRARATSAPVVINAGAGDLESMYYTRRVDDPAAAAADGAAPAAPAAAPMEAIIRMDDNDPEERYTTGAKQAEYLDNKVQAESAYKKQGANQDAANGFGGGAPASSSYDFAADMIGADNVSTMQAFQGSRILHLGKQNVNTMGDELIATDPESGSTLWTYKFEGDLARQGGQLATAPLSAGDSVIVATLAGKLLRTDPSSGKVKGTWDVGSPVRAQPVVVDGWIYVGTEDGKLVAIDTGEKALTGWAMWGANAARTGLR
jgi:outer membrane protein assembly factor BamB